MASTTGVIIFRSFANGNGIKGGYMEEEKTQQLSVSESTTRHKVFGKIK